MSDKFAVVTVSSDDFALGSAVALASFRQSNRWFSGDTVVIATDLSDDRRALVRAAGPTEFRAPSNELLRRIDALCDARPELRTRRLRFCSLESFALAGYDKVLFLDSATVVSGDFEELFRRPEPFIAAPDKATLIGKRRDQTSFEPVDANDPAGFASFNAGMMLIGHALLAGTVYADLLDLLALTDASTLQVVGKLRIPNAVPHYLDGARISCGLSVIGAIVGEFFAGYGAEDFGLGYLIILTNAQTKTDYLFASILFSTLLGLSFFAVVSLARQVVLRRWRGGIE